MSNYMKKIANNTVFYAKKYSPEMLLVAGVIGTVVGTVMACKATLKATEILESTKESVDKVRQCADDETLADEYSETDRMKDLALVYSQSAVQMVKLYAPAVSVMVGSTACMLSSNQILRKRSIALGSAYAVVDQGFKAYRKRVEERFGVEVEKELNFGLRKTTVQTTTVNEKTGKEKVVEEEVYELDRKLSSPYAMFFDASNPYWEKDSQYNFMFLRQQQQYWNDKLIVDGRVFLNEVLESLGFPKTKAGQMVGWNYKPNNTSIDSYIDFGIYDYEKADVRRFIEGYENVILLDFNVDGNIYDTM
ncbi:MAG: DUF6353 family protein [Bacillota bacterium]